MWGTLNPFPFFTGGSQPAPAQRYILTHNGVNSYIDTGGYTYSGDFWIEVDVEIPSSLPTSNQAFFGGNGSNSTDSGSFAAMITNSGLSVQIPTPNGLKFGLTGSLVSHLGSSIKLKVQRIGALFSLFVNNVEVDTFDTASFGVIDMKVQFLAKWFTLYHFAGYIHDYKDSLGNNLPIDDNSTTVIRNTATVLGSDLPTNDYSNAFWTGSFDQQSSGDGFFVTSGGGLGPRTDPDTFITSGNTYLIKASNLSAGVTVNIRTTEGGVDVVLTSDGEALFTVPDGYTSCQLYIRAGSAGTHNANVSVREANGYATPVNVTPSMWSLENV